MPQDAASPLGVTGQPLVAGAFGAGDMQGGEGGVVAQAELSGLVEVAAGQQPWVVGEGEGEIVDRACGSSGPPRPHIPWGDTITALGKQADMDLQQISIKHHAAEKVRDIQNNKIPNPRRLFVAEGLFEHNIVLESGVTVDTFFWCPEAAYSAEAQKRSAELVARARRAYRISEKTLQRLAERPNPDGLISLAEMPQWGADEIPLGKDALVLVTDAVEIPGNLGTLIRTLDACKADCLVMTNRRTRMTHPKVLRSSQGMSMKVPSFEFEEVADAISWLKRSRFNVLITDTEESANYRRCDYRGRTALVVGSERYGVSQPWYDAGFPRIGIPMLGSADSLNVAISASVMLYEARAQKDRW